MSKQKKTEYMIVGAMLAVAIVVILIMRLKPGGSKILVTVGGVEYGTFYLNRDCEIEIASENGVNVLKIEDGKARMISATCPDKICMSMSPLSKEVDGMIVCLPNEVIVETVDY